MPDFNDNGTRNEIIALRAEVDALRARLDSLGGGMGGGGGAGAPPPDTGGPPLAHVRIVTDVTLESSSDSSAGWTATLVKYWRDAYVHLGSSSLSSASSSAIMGYVAEEV